MTAISNNVKERAGQTLTLNNLKAGQKYQLQLWVNDYRIGAAGTNNRSAVFNAYQLRALPRWCCDREGSPGSPAAATAGLVGLRPTMRCSVRGVQGSPAILRREGTCSAARSGWRTLTSGGR